MSRVTLAAAVAAMSFLSSPAMAQVAVGPFVGGTFAGSAEQRRAVYGGVLAIGGTVGVDVDFGHAPDFFGTGGTFGDLGEVSIATLMFNLRIGGNTARAGIAPFVSGGAGLLRTTLTSDVEFLDDVSRNDFGMNVGGGLQAAFGRHLGLRGDLRYFRRAKDDDDSLLLQRLGIDRDAFSFWRGTVALTFGF
jgi:opacity protein-like surface antigen